jgi:acyl carrier protein
MDESRVKVRSFLARSFRGHELRDTEDIFALGFVNSLLAMQLVNFIEKEFSITVEDSDLELNNFRTIDNIAALIARKQADYARS